MFKIEVIHQQNKVAGAKLHYPKVYNVDPTPIRLAPIDTMSRIAEINILKFIVTRLKRYIAQRDRAYKHSSSYTSARKHAIDRINFALANCEEARLRKLILRIANLQLSFNQVAPHWKSQKYNHYIREVKPLIDWCINAAEEKYKTPLRRRTAL